jgi:hypothetical protein
LRYHDRIVCALAGLQAQRRVDPQSMRRRDANGDEAIAADLLLRLHGETGNATARLNTWRREHGILSAITGARSRSWRK